MDFALVDEWSLELFWFALVALRCAICSLGLEELWSSFCFVWSRGDVDLALVDVLVVGIFFWQFIVWWK